MTKKTSYLDLVGFDTPEQAYRKIKEWSSDLSDDEHFIRSTIFDIHAGIEILFRKVFFNYFKPITFQTGKESEDNIVFNSLEKMVNSLSFGEMYKILWPILQHWPYDVASIKSLNDLRNQVAHKVDIQNIDYKGRNPFKDADCFAQVFFDAWATRKELSKFFQRRVVDQQEEFKIYYEAFKDLQELKEKVKALES